MLKRNKFTIALLAVTGSLVLGTIAQIMNAKEDKPPILIETKTVSGVFYSTQDIPFDVVFRNNEDDVVRLLNVFDDPKSHLIFFIINLRDSNGTPISTLGGGKISLSKDSMKYIELAKGEEFTVRLNLKDYFPSDAAIKAGNYDVSVTYRNQYGENCFRGSVESNTLNLYLNESDK